MPVSNEHLNSLCQVWDGITSSMMDIEEAKQKEKEGKLQITTNLQAKDLKRKEEFTSTKVAKVEDEKLDEKPKRKLLYATRELKADQSGNA